MLSRIKVIPKKTSILILFLVCKFVIQYTLISSAYDLQRDEYLHLDQAHHLAWGFVSVPPVTSWISVLIYGLGGTVFWIKFFPALFGALTIFVVWIAIESLNGSLLALILGSTCMLFSSLLRLNTLYQPNSLDVLCWTAFYFLIIQYFKTKDIKWIFIAAILFAIGFLNKYNLIFLLMGLLPALFLSKQRFVFAEPQFYVAILVGILLVSPNIYWQLKNNFPVIHHLRELADTQLVHVELLGFLKSQLLFFAGALFVLFFGLYALLYYQPFRSYRFFFLSLIFTLSIFMYFHAKDYYAIGIYPIYIAFGSAFIGDGSKGWKQYLGLVLMAIPVISFLLVYPAAYAFEKPQYILNHPTLFKQLGQLRWEDGKDHALPQDNADMLGWKELAVKVDSICSRLPDLDHTLILCDNYGEAGAINYYTTNKKIRASSFSADYLSWIEFSRKILNVVLIKPTYDRDKKRKKEIPLFDTVYLAGRRINGYAREDTISIYLLVGAKVNVNKLIKKEADRDRRR